ncbi:hypothetical protein OG585_45015 [Streptomyces sp. NBC_01340]|nr:MULTISPECIES: hypothetical protein [unclassified Streptomyces]MCX4459891.1 hypothetical protein [Streptomyces sp. NBC_01719]MCX4499249.1 hypothetical protein [Streptomyces sp. NBC_01728]MCX4594831.1 hypothetical protein [Streptomyces sp. NBC_01549]WSI43655.1 hypothetical protein OG585_45015 [Streptomyces sp. NBC_01340]
MGVEATPSAVRVTLLFTSSMKARETLLAAPSVSTMAPRWTSAAIEVVQP